MEGVAIIVMMVLACSIMVYFELSAGHLAKQSVECMCTQP